MTDRYGDIWIAIEGESASRIYDIIVNSRIYKEFPEDMKLDYRENLLFIEDSWWGYSPFADFVMPFLMGDDYYYLQYLGHEFRWETNDHEGKYFTIPAEANMGVIWHLSLNANSANEATKINEYARELNKKYNLELCTVEYRGLEFFDWGFCYVDVDSDNIKVAEEMIKEVVAHFPDMKLTFQGSGDEACYHWEKRSKNGVLVAVEPWRVGVHCEKENFGELRALVSFIKQQGFEVSCKVNENALYWKYDHITEENTCNDTIVELSKKMPQATICSYKQIMLDNYPKIETFCVMKDGEGEWLVDLAFEDLIEYDCSNGYRWYKPGSIWKTIKDPECCFEQLLRKARGGEEASVDSVYGVLKCSVDERERNSDGRELAHWLALFKPEDKQWLMETDRTLYDCIVLAGMHHNWHSEDGNMPLFEYNAEDEKRLLERVSSNWAEFPLNSTYYEQKGYISLLKFTNLNYRSILRNYIEGIEPYMDKTDERLQWFRKEIGDN